MMASSAFHAGHSDVAEIETAYHTLAPLLGIGAAGVFLVSLIASGISSSAVGTMAGQMIMQGFICFRIPFWFRRLVTMIPAFIVVALGVNATNALVISQVVLSIALPLPMIALLMFTRRADIMGQFVNSRLTNITAIGCDRGGVAAQRNSDPANTRRAISRVAGVMSKRFAANGFRRDASLPDVSGLPAQGWAVFDQAAGRRRKAAAHGRESARYC